MFGTKKQPEPKQNPAAGENSTPSQPPKRKKRHILARLLKYSLLCVLLVLAVASAALVWLTQSQKGQALLVQTVNSALAPAPDSKRLAFKITALQGSLPFNFEIGIEASDAKGVWLIAPRNRFALNWRELPDKIHISALEALDVDISRLPEAEPDPTPAPPAKPMTMADMRNILAQGGEFLARPPWWLPEIVVEGVKFEPVLLPEGLIPQKEAKRPALAASLGLAVKNGHIAANARANLKNADNAAVDLSQFAFQALNFELSLNGQPASQGLSANINARTGLEAVQLMVPDLPKDFLGQNIELNLALNAEAGADAANLRLQGPNLSAGHVSLDTTGNWQSGKEWAHNGIDGPVDLSLALNVKPPQPDGEKPTFLDMIREPVTLNATLKGDLPSVGLDVDLAAQELAASGHSMKNLRLALVSQKLDLPFSDAALRLLENEHHIDLKLSCLLDKDPVELSSQCFFQQIKDQSAESGSPTSQDEPSWLAGLRDLRLSALGLKGDGNIRAMLPAGHDPALNGAIHLEIEQWDAIARFVPGQKFSGQVKADIELSAKDSSGNGSQNGLFKLAIPSFAMLPDADGKGVAISGLSGQVLLEDIFKNLKVDADVATRKIAAAGMNFGAQIKAHGPVAGPLNASLTTTGDISSRLAAQWQPGLVRVGTLDVRMQAPTANGKALLGVKSSGAAEISYGDQGIAVKNLDLGIIPSGRLRASGALAPDKLDFDLGLENLQFKPWQVLASQIPDGSASLKVSLKGSPPTPRGSFNLAVNKVKVPGVQLAPISASLKGVIENSGGGSALKARFELDKQTIKTLGGNVASISASVPLLFGADGIPKPDMKGNLAARVRWDGALGPIWNLLPIPDRRLNGRLAINIDAGGKLDAPKVKGGVNISKARYEDLLLGVLITDINLRLDLSDRNLAEAHAQMGKTPALPGSMKLALNASDGRGGTVNVDGSGALDGNNLDITAKINRLRPLRRRDVHVELSGNAKVSGSATAPVVDGEIIVNQGEVLLDNISFTGSVTTLPITTPEQLKKDKKEAQEANAQTPAKTTDKGQGSLNVRINMLPRFVVEGRGLTSIWQAHLLVGGTPVNPQITGNVSVVKGNFDFLGKNFALTRGLVTFAGGSISNPLLDIEMTNETPDLTAHILVTGPVSKIKLTMSSEPELPRDEILSRVLFGRSINDLSRLEALQLAGAVAQLAGFGSGAGGILTFAKKTLGVDVLRVGTSSSDAAGEPGDTTAGGTTIEMGKYINDMIYMGVQQGMKADSTAFIIQMELTPRTSFELRTEQNNTWGGIKWKYNY